MDQSLYSIVYDIYRVYFLTVQNANISLHPITVINDTFCIYFKIFFD